MMGGQAAHDHRQTYRKKMKREGSLQINMWLPPEIAYHVERKAFNEMIPKSVAVEYMLREFLGVEAKA
jgi:hypothetical protein